MPYTTDAPPDRIKHLPEHAQHIWIAAYNSAHEQYRGDEQKANATAWAAVKTKYKQVDGKWVAKEATEVQKMADNDKPNTAIPSEPTNVTQEFQLYIPIVKVDEATRHVLGFATLEQPDRAGETMDYDSSKSYFMEWSNDAFKRSGGKSKGNVREMHQPIAAGLVSELSADDTRKGVYVDTECVDDGTWNKILKGVLTGFSVGGKYVRRWWDNTTTRYTARPNEISYVDVPTVPGAVFEFVKSDGTSEQRQFAAYEMPETTTDRVSSAIKFLDAVGDIIRKALPSASKPLSRPVDGASIQQYPTPNAPETLPQQTANALPGRMPAPQPTPQLLIPPTQKLTKADMKCPHCGAQMTVEKVGACKCAKCGKGCNAEADGDGYKLIKADDAADETEELVKLIGIGAKEFIGFPEDFNKATIPKKEEEPKTPPKGYPEDRSKYGDPANYSWPVDTKARAASARAYYNAGKGKDKYSDREWAILGRRIVRLANGLGRKYKFNPRTKQIEDADETQGGKMQKGVQDMVAAARELAGKLRAQVASGDAQGATSSLDQLDAALDVGEDSMTDKGAPATTIPSTASTPGTATTKSTDATATTSTTTSPSTVTKADAAPAPQAAPQSLPVTVPTDLAAVLSPTMPALAKATDPPTLAATPGPPPAAPLTFFSPVGEEEHIRQKVPLLIKTLASGGRYAADDAISLFKSDGGRLDWNLFDKTLHAAYRVVLGAGGFKDANAAEFRKMAVAALDGNEIAARGLMNDFEKGVSSTTAPGYYLQLLVKLMLPVLTPLGNRLPSQKPRTGGKQAEWRVISGFSNLDETEGMNVAEASTTLGSTTGTGQAIDETPILFQTPYRRYALNDAVTVEAQYAMLGYDDAFQMSIVRALTALLRIREMALLWNNYAAIGTIGTVSVTSTGSGSGLSGGTNDKFAVTGLTGRGWRKNALGKGGKGGASTVDGETAATLSSATDISTKDSVTISWAWKHGCAAYNLYYLPAGVVASARYVGTYTVNKVTLTSLPAMGAALAYPTVDGTANSNGYEGALAWCEHATIYSQTISNKSFTDQAGAALTLTGPNSVKEVDGILSALMTNWQIAPSLLLGSSNTALHLANIIGSGTNPPWLINVASGPMQGSLVGGVWMGGYVNKYALGIQNVPKVIDIMAHPYAPDGTLLFFSETIPYPMAREARGWLIEQQIPLTYWPLAALTAHWPFMLFIDEVLECFHPGAAAAIAGINVS